MQIERLEILDIRLGRPSEDHAEARWVRRSKRLKCGCIRRGKGVCPFGTPFCFVTSSQAFKTGVSGFRPRALPLGCGGEMVLWMSTQ